MVAFSVLIGASGLATGLFMLVLARTMMSLADGAYTPACLAPLPEGSRAMRQVCVSHRDKSQLPGRGQKRSHDKLANVSGGSSNQDHSQFFQATSDLAATVFSIAPMPSISHRTTSPACRNFGGSMPAPTPSGVPVAMRSPGWSVNAVVR